jgi:hypothetical protein
VQLLKREEKLGSTMGSSSRSPPIGMVNVEVPKQYMISRIVGNGSRNMGKNFMSVKKEWFICR